MYLKIPAINDTSNELIPDEELLHKEEAFEILEEFEVNEERLVEEFDFLMYDLDMSCELCTPCSEGCFRNMYGKVDIILLMMRSKFK